MTLEVITLRFSSLQKILFVGVCIIVISGALVFIKDEFGLSKAQRELVVGATTFGAIFGGFFAGLVSFFFSHDIICIP